MYKTHITRKCGGGGREKERKRGRECICGGDGKLVEQEAKIRNVRFLDVYNITTDAEVESIFRFAKGSILCVCFLILSNCCSALYVALLMCLP